MFTVYTRGSLCLLLAAMLVAFVLTACLPQTSSTGSSLEISDAAAARASEDPKPGSAQVVMLTKLLESAGATVQLDGRPDQEMFDEAVGWRVQVNGTALEVFEFADAETRLSAGHRLAREQADFLITESYDQGGDLEQQTQFWGYEALLVAYRGQNAKILHLLKASLGDPLLDKASFDEMGTPVAGDLIQFDEHGISLKFDSSLATAVQSTVVPGMTAEQASGFTQLVIPDHVVLSFEPSYADDRALYRQAANLDSQAHIAIYPVARYAKMNELADEQLGLLQPFLSGDLQNEISELPFLPTVNAARPFQAQPSTLLFANGAGVRYLTQVAQETRPVNNGELFFTFQGLTDDGAYYVAAFFPVATASLPNDAMITDQVAFDTNFPRYMEATVEGLNQLSPADFKPDLAVLDQLIMSLRVQPTRQLFGDEQNQSSEGQLPASTVRPPVGLVYSNAEGLWQTDSSGKAHFLLEVKDFRALALSPDLSYAAYFDGDGRLWLADLLSGNIQQLASDADLAWSVSWGDDRTLLLGVWLNLEEKEGQSSGHLATLGIESGRLQVLDKAYLSLGRPAMAPDGQTIAYDISPYYRDISGTGRLYEPETGSKSFELDAYGDAAKDRPWHLFNPVWSPDGTRLTWQWNTPEGSAELIAFDLLRSVATRLHSWQPRGFGALPPSAVWQPEGTQVALEIWASEPEDSGLWVLAADGGSAVHVSSGGSNAHWLETGRLVFADCDANQMCTNKLFDLATGRADTLELPTGTVQYVPYTPEPPAAEWRR